MTVHVTDVLTAVGFLECSLKALKASNLHGIYVHDTENKKIVT